MRPRGRLLVVAALAVIGVAGAAAVWLGGAPTSAPAPTFLTPRTDHQPERPQRHVPAAARPAPRRPVRHPADEQDEGLLPHPAVVAGAVDHVVQIAPAGAAHAGRLRRMSMARVLATPLRRTRTVTSARTTTSRSSIRRLRSTTRAARFSTARSRSTRSGAGSAAVARPTTMATRPSSTTGSPNRWIITQFSVSTTPYLECVAVSQTGDPTGAYYRYSFSYGNSSFPDYPKLAVWPDAYYVTFNIFTGGTTFAGAQACAYDRTSMLAGLPATQQCFTTSSTYGGLLPSDLDGSRLPPAGSPDYLVSLGATNTSLGHLEVPRRLDDAGELHLHGTNRTWRVRLHASMRRHRRHLRSPVGDDQPAGHARRPADVPARIPQLRRSRVARRQPQRDGRLEHRASAGTSFGSPSGSLSVYQQGTYAPDSSYRWMGSIAQDQSGDMALGSAFRAAASIRRSPTRVGSR